MQIDDEQFSKLIDDVMDELPEEYIKNLNNVAVTYETEPTEIQRKELALRCNQTLFGLYQGIPLTQRGNGYNLVLPDKITIFKGPITRFANDTGELRQQVKHTLWHEIAHHYGLDHARIHELENK